MTPSVSLNPPSDNNDEDILFITEDDFPFVAPSDGDESSTESQAWKVIIIDDEPDVHRATELALKNFRFEGKPLTFFSAFSAEEGKHLITVVHPDAAVIILDVVMETHDAGLKVIQYIRDELHNQQVRIILRTGQPGEAPEESVIMNYDINDYKLKVELTRQRMLTSTISALRSFRDIVTIEQQRLELTQTLEHLRLTQSKLQEYTHTLEHRVLERTAALEAANLELQRMAILDGLTRIANRRHFDDYLQEKWQQFQNKFLSLILIDVDYFKAYNDYYGHQAGDHCLQTVAQVFLSIPIRTTDLVARYGGEEFVLVLPGAPMKRACQVAEQILLNVRSLNIPHAQSQVSDRITVSLGVTSVLLESHISTQAVVESADKALYQAKQNGRDRYCSADF